MLARSVGAVAHLEAPQFWLVEPLRKTVPVVNAHSIEETRIFAALFPVASLQIDWSFRRNRCADHCCQLVKQAGDGKENEDDRHAPSLFGPEVP